MQVEIVQQGYMGIRNFAEAASQGQLVAVSTPVGLLRITYSSFAPPTPLVGQVVTQVVIGVVAALPFLRRRNVYTALFTLTFWLAGLTTIVAQPVRTSSGQVSPLLHGALWALLASDVVLVMWGTCASLLYVVHIHHAQLMWARPQRRTIHMSGVEPLRRKVTILICGQGLALVVLMVLAPVAAGDPVISQQGIWFPVSADMPTAALLYAIVGKGYILGMFSWAIYGLQHVARHFLRHPIMRLGAWLGFCVACGMLLQSLVVAVAQARGLNFYATRAGQETLSIWLTLGFVLPLSALTVVGGVNRWRLFRLARDLRAFAGYLVTTLAHEQPQRRQEVNAWIAQLFGADADLVTLPLAHPRTLRQRLGSLVRDMSRTLQTPTGGVDTLVAFLRDVIEAVYPQPGDVMLIAAIWLWRQPPSIARRFTDRDIAALLLSATLIGGEQGLFAQLPLPAPEPLQRAFSGSNWRDWRQWGSPVGASFLQSVWRLLTGSPRSGLAPEVQQGVVALRSLLPLLGSDDRSDLIDRWMGTVEQGAKELASSPKDFDNNAVGHDEQPPDVLAEWWRPRAPRPSEA